MQFCFETYASGLLYITRTPRNFKEMLIIKTFLFESTQGRWLYALLACLEKPLLPEAHSLIRQLARRCSEVRVLEVRSNIALHKGLAELSKLLGG